MTRHRPAPRSVLSGLAALALTLFPASVAPAFAAGEVDGPEMLSWMSYAEDGASVTPGVTYTIEKMLADAVTPDPAYAPLTVVNEGQNDACTGPSRQLAVCVEPDTIPGYEGFSQYGAMYRITNSELYPGSAGYAFMYTGALAAPPTGVVVATPSWGVHTAMFGWFQLPTPQRLTWQVHLDDADASPAPNTTWEVRSGDATLQTITDNGQGDTDPAEGTITVDSRVLPQDADLQLVLVDGAGAEPVSGTSQSIRTTIQGGAVLTTDGADLATAVLTIPVTPTPDPEPEPEPEPEPGNPDPGTTNPGTTNPGTTNPGTTNPGTTNPGTTNPGTTNPGTTNPGTTNPGTTNPGTPPQIQNPGGLITPTPPEGTANPGNPEVPVGPVPETPGMPVTSAGYREPLISASAALPARLQDARATSATPSSAVAPTAHVPATPEHASEPAPAAPAAPSEPAEKPPVAMLPDTGSLAGARPLLTDQQRAAIADAAREHEQLFTTRDAVAITAAAGSLGAAGATLHLRNMRRGALM